MRVTVVGQPEFVLPLTPQLVEGLRRLSSTHYDSTCRAACHQGGVLYGWKARFQLLTPDEVVEVRVRWRDLDLVLKICEGVPQLVGTECHEPVLEFAHAVHHAMQTVQREGLTREWRLEL